MNRRSVYKLLIDLPFLKKGTKFVFYDASGDVFWENYDAEEGKETEYPIRKALAGYLWMLRTEKGYMKFIESEQNNNKG